MGNKHTPNTKDIAINVQGAGKTFKLPHEKQTSLKGSFLSRVKGKTTYEKQRALNDVSFVVNKGDFFGIVGRNGSGKSTLLKCIAGVYTPDEGSIIVNGSLVPFIELGVGFNPELSGRDNVYLNGALLGFDRKQMEAMYEDIVDFAELKPFMDQKLKNYSSGMQVRLAFSIAIQAKGDILLLDEVLAVGDASFQKKCTTYFEELKEQKRTVVLVTHDMSAVTRFCNKAMLLEEGKIKTMGPPSEIANQYSLDNMNTVSKTNTGPKKEKQTNKNKSLAEAIKFLEIRPVSSQSLKNTEDFEFEIAYELNTDIEVDLGISVMHQGRSIIEHNTKELHLGSKKNTPYKIRYSLPLKYFIPKEYSVDVAIFQRSDFKLIGFNINSCSFMIIYESGPKGGLVNTRGRWLTMEETA
ncbi:ABC transporter ATP-binding protein [soil metagenome]